MATVTELHVNGARCRVSETSRLAEATLLLTDPRDLIDGAERERVVRLCGSVRLVRGLGDCYGYYLVARGLADVMIEPHVAPWDVAALKVIVEEAGGIYSNFADDRRAFGTGTSSGVGSLATNGRLHGAVLDVVRPHLR